MMMNFLLQGKTALVCGATQGIGRATATALASAGARVVISGRNDEGITKVLASLPTVTSGAHTSLLMDHADAAAMERAADALLANIGPVHIVVMNTGGPDAGFLIDTSTDDIEKCMRQHVATAHKLAQVMAPGMRANMFGRIITVGSTGIERPIRAQGVSNVVRSALANWTRTLAGELGGFGITVNLIMAGATRTQRLESIIAGRAARSGNTIDEVEANMVRTIPVGRLAAPEEIAAVIAFLASPAAGYVNGAFIPVDGGLLCTQA